MICTVVADGRVIDDFQLKKGGSGIEYVNFSLAVTNGYGKNENTFFLECISYQPIAKRLIEAKVGKGSLIKAVGNLDVRDYIRIDGSKTKIIKIVLSDWCYSQVGHVKKKEQESL